MVGLTVAKREDLVAAARGRRAASRREPGLGRDPDASRDAGRRRHQRHHRRPHRRHRRLGLPVSPARHPALRPRRAAADRGQLGHAAARPRAARPGDPGPTAEGRPDSGGDRHRRSCGGRRRRRQARGDGPRPRRRDPHQRLQPEPRRGPAVDPRPEHQLAGQRAQAGVAARATRFGSRSSPRARSRARASATWTTARWS